jgi:hypothetical protein
MTVIRIRSSLVKRSEKDWTSKISLGRDAHRRVWGRGARPNGPVGCSTVGCKYATELTYDPWPRLTPVSLN